MRPLGSFWFHSQYGAIDPDDVGNCPRELNPFQKFYVRMMFAEVKLMACLLIASTVGAVFWLVSWLHGDPIF